MEIFYSPEIRDGRCILSDDEAAHCIKVLRHKEGDTISVIDGKGNMYSCRILSASSRCAEAEIISSEENWGTHPYRLHLAVAPTKNADRYEWFAEKACEIGVDEITPLIGEHSERKIFKTSRIEKILISAAKQSLKGSVPEINDPVPVKDFIRSCAETDDKSCQEKPLMLIAWCFEDEEHPRTSIKEALEGYNGRDVIVMIGPEGDFSKEEGRSAVSSGFIPVHLGNSRLRTETAAVTAAEAAYFRWM